MQAILNKIKSVSQPAIISVNSISEARDFVESYCRMLDIFPSDFIDFSPEDGVEILRKQIIKIKIKPHSSNLRLLAIYNSQDLTSDQANTLLKLLEEPPDYARILIFTTSSARLISTVKSRSLLFGLPPQNSDRDSGWLKLFEAGGFNNLVAALKDIESGDIPAIFKEVMVQIKHQKASENNFLQLYRKIGEGLILISKTNANRKLVMENIFVWWKLKQIK